MNFTKRSNNFILTNGSEIQGEIKRRIQSATSSIDIAVAWFTDPELFDALLQRIEQGVRVRIVIAENEENTKLPFQELEAKGAKVCRIKGSGFGMMHQKYAIIDRNLVVNGSFNWTVNARSNNSESAIFTTEKGIVEKLTENFNDFLKNDVDAEQKIISLEDSEGLMQVDQSDEVRFIEHLNQLTAGLVDNYDHEKIENLGYQSSKENQGNSVVFASYLDRVLNEYRSSLHTDENKKKVYLSRLEAEWQAREEEISTMQEGAESTLEELHEYRKARLEERVHACKDEVQALEKELISSENGIKSKENKVENLEDDIREIRLETPTRPLTFKNGWYYGVAILVFFLYLFIFYSSAVYTLQFAKDEAMRAVAQGVIIPNIDFFNPNALWKIIDKGFAEMVFAFLVVLIPMALSMVKVLTNSKFWEYLLGWGVAILGFDFFVAAAVTTTIFEVKFLSGEVSGEYVLLEAMQTLDFWKVFMFGAIPLLIFKFLGLKVYSRVKESSLDYIDKNKASKIRILKEDILQIQSECEELKVVHKHLESDLENTSKQLSELKEMIQTESGKHLEEIQALKEKFQSKLVRNKRILEIYKGNIDSSSSKFAKDVIKARSSSLIQGWNKFLSEYYSQQEVNHRNEEIHAIYNEWLDANFLQTLEFSN